MSFDAELGPLNYVVVTFPSAPVPAGGLTEILGLVDAGRILVLDAEFVVLADDGQGRTTTAEEVGAPEFAGSSSGIIDAGDVALVAAAVPPGGVGLVVVYEDLALLPAIRAFTAEGASVVAEGPIVVDDLVASIDATES